MIRSVFYGFAAIVGALDSISKARFWASEPISIGWNPVKLIPIDLAKNPQAVRNGTIQPAAIQADDHVSSPNPGLTTIGPLWPDGRTIGSCWVESTYWDAMPPAYKPERVPKDVPCFDYELTSYLYWDGPLAYRRFCGFHAAIIQESGTNALCQIWSAGKKGVGAPYGAWWLDLAAVAHPIDPQMPIPGLIGVGTGMAKTGPLFLDTSAINSLALRGPKIPFWLGADLFPNWS